MAKRSETEESRGRRPLEIHSFALLLDVPHGYGRSMARGDEDWPGNARVFSTSV